MCELIRWEELFHSIIIYQIITKNTINIIQFCKFYSIKLKKNFKGF